MQNNFEVKYKNSPDIFNFLRVFALFCVLITHSRIVISQNIPAFKSATAWEWYSYTPAWIAMGMFFLISGYLLGRGFYNNKYKTSIDGILNFWLTKLIRILPMYLFFLVVYFIFIKPDWIFVNGISALFPILTFTYNGDPGGMGLGALWFVSTIFQLYLLAPIFYKFIFDKFRKYSLLLFFVILFSGFAYRLISFNLNIDWYNQVYLPSWANIDFFFIGFLMNYFTQNSSDNKMKKYCRIISIPILFIFTAYLSFLYYSKEYIFLRYYAPSIIILIFSLVFYSFDYKEKISSAKVTLFNLVKNPLRIIDVLGGLSFGFYLYHSFFLSIFPKILMSKNIFPEYISNGRCLTYTYIFTFFILLIWSSILYKLIEKPANKYRVNLDISVIKLFYLIVEKLNKIISRGGG